MSVQKFIVFFLTSLLGIVFLFSGYTKLFPIELFEFNFVDLGIAKWTMASIIARIIIGVEFIVGLMLLINFCWEKVAIKIAIALLLFFTAYLIFAIIKDGDKGNCGCFGTFLQMTPSQSIIKNLIMLFIAFLLMRYHSFTPKLWIKYKKIIGLFLFILGLSAPFILNPVNGEVVSNFADDATNYQMDLEALYKDKNYPGPPVNLTKNKQLVAFLSLTCSHCRIAAFKLHIIKKQHPELPIYFILNGEKADIEKFHLDTRSQNVPYTLFNNPNFLKLSGPYLPAIFLLDNGIVKKKYNYLTIDEEELVSFLKK